MRKRALFVIAGLTLAMISGFVGLLFLLPDPPVSTARFAKVQKGMTQAEVEELLGGPPGDYQTGRGSGMFVIDFLSPGDSVSKEWTGDDGVALVAFDRSGRVVTCQFFESARRDWSLLAKLRHWLRF